MGDTNLFFFSNKINPYFFYKLIMKKWLIKICYVPIENKFQTGGLQHISYYLFGQSNFNFVCNWLFKIYFMYINLILTEC